MKLQLTDADAELLILLLSQRIEWAEKTLEHVERHRRIFPAFEVVMEGQPKTDYLCETKARGEAARVLLKKILDGCKTPLVAPLGSTPS